MLPRESARLDADQLEKLYTSLGEVEADNVLSRAMEEMAIRIKQSEKHLRCRGVRRNAAHDLLAYQDRRSSRDEHSLAGVW